MSKLYYIENCGCDDTTCGLASLDDEAFAIFKTIIEDLNKNSHYGCMPTIEVYAINEEDIKEVTVDPNKEWHEEGYVSKNDILNMDGKTYTLNCDRWTLYSDTVRKVI